MLSSPADSLFATKRDSLLFYSVIFRPFKVRYVRVKLHLPLARNLCLSHMSCLKQRGKKVHFPGLFLHLLSNYLKTALMMRETVRCEVKYFPKQNDHFLKSKLKLHVTTIILFFRSPGSATETPSCLPSTHTSTRAATGSRCSTMSGGRQVERNRTKLIRILYRTMKLHFQRSGD